MEETIPRTDVGQLPAEAAARGALIDAYVKADEYLRLGMSNDPARHTVDPSIVERLSIRMLVKHFGWVVTEPGRLHRAAGPWD